LKKHVNAPLIFESKERMMAVIFAHKPQTSRTNPLPVGDSGGAVTFKEDNEYCILGVISTRLFPNSKQKV
jgi:hypothetical protein